MQRAILLASVVLLVQLGLVAVMHLGGRDMEASSRGERLLAIVPETVAVIRLEDKEEKSLVLRRHESGWRIDGPGGLQAAADEQQVLELLRKLAGFRRGLAVATSEEAAERFQVSPKNFAHRLVLEDRDGGVAEVFFGTSSGFNQMHSRISGRMEIFTVPLGSHEIDPLVEQWIDREILQLKEENLARLEFDTIRLLREEDGGWKAETPGQVDIGPERAAQLAEAVSGLQVHGYYAQTQNPGQEAAKDAMAFTTVAADGSVLSWRITREEDWYGVTRSDHGVTFKVSSWQIEELQKLLEGEEEERGDAALKENDAVSRGIVVEDEQRK